MGMEFWDFSRKDWVERLTTGRSLMPELPLFTADAERAVKIFNMLRLPDVPDKPALIEAGADWFREIVAALFGSIDPDSGRRMVGELFCLAPKKSSKTSYGAALMMTALLMNKRPRAEFLLVAPSQAISDLAFAQAIGMIEADEEGFLQKRFHIREHLKEIKDRRTGAKLKVKTFDSKILTGVKPAGILIDELHEIARDANASRVIGQLRGGLIPNPEGFLVFITTQSDREPQGAFKAELKKARAIRDGKIKGVMLPLLYEFPAAMIKADEWRDPSTWWMVTPNRGKSITVERLIPDFEGAVEAGIDELRRWASQHLNLEIGLALGTDRWAGADYWEAAADPTLRSLDELLARSEVCTIGIDGGGLDDLLGVTVLGRERHTRRWLHWSKAFAFTKVLERRPDIAARLHDFQTDGDLEIIDVLGDDITGVMEIVTQVAESGLLAEKYAIGLDPVGVAAIVDAIVEVGIVEPQYTGVSQGWTLSGAIKGVERKLADGTFLHGGRPLMAWNVGNAKAEAKGNALTITKQQAGAAKIDNLMATFNAAQLMARNPEARGQSFWQSLPLAGAAPLAGVAPQPQTEPA
jgi:phage terminase large subunit-like protein